ncbi:MAG: hypothetical protein FJW40_14715 [Acidobacteria bacterium]|nr:hypothetical protein [Acidobacteriota bacterium]
MHGKEDQLRGWRRWLTPSFADLFFITLPVWLFVAPADGWRGLLGDGDTGWHIRTGEWVLAYGTAPRVDLFSFSRPGDPWYAWEWLADVAMAGLHRWGGLGAVALAAAVVISLFALILLRHVIWSGANGFVGLMVTWLAIGAASTHFLARPHVFTLLFLAGGLWLLAIDRKRQTPWIWAMAPLTVVWTNLHSGVFGWIACLGLWFVSDVWVAWKTGIQVRARRTGWLLAACIAGTLVNPYSFELHRHVFSYMRSDWIRDMVQEFQSPSFRSGNMRLFEILLILGLMTVAWRLWRDRRFTGETLMVVFWAHMALGSVRHVPIYALVAAPLIASELTGAWRRVCRHSPRSSLGRVLFDMGAGLGRAMGRSSAWAALALAAAAGFAGHLALPGNFDPAKFPEAMLDRHRGELMNARILAPDEWGDYLIYRAWPEQRVFIDGRTDFYGPRVGNEYVRMMEGKPGWNRLLAAHGFTHVLCPATWPLAELLKTQGAWRLADSDRLALLFVREGGSETAHLLLGPGTAESKEDKAPR